MKIFALSILIGLLAFNDKLYELPQQPTTLIYDIGQDTIPEDKGGLIENEYKKCLALANEDERYDCLYELHERISKETKAILRDSGMVLDSIEGKVDLL